MKSKTEKLAELHKRDEAYHEQLEKAVGKLLKPGMIVSWETTRNGTVYTHRGTINHVFTGGRSQFQVRVQNATTLKIVDVWANPENGFRILE